MTRFIHDQFAKQYLSEILSSFGTVETSKDIASEVRQVDVFFTPSPSAPDANELGLLGTLTTTPAIFEPFRNPVTESDIRSCLLKLFVLQAKWERDTQSGQHSDTELPKLWILTPTASTNLLANAKAEESEEGPSGIYYLGNLYRSAIVVIHQLPATPETLWLRLLGRGRVQEQAIRELEELPKTNPWRANALKLVAQLLTILAMRQNREVDPDNEEIIVTLTQLYEEAVAQLREELRQEARQEAQREAQQERLRFVADILRVRFGEIDAELAEIVEAIATLPSEEFTPLLLQLSREELLARFQPNSL